MQLGKVIAALLLITAVLAAVLVFAQAPFDNSTFAYGQVKPFDGLLIHRPTPWLLRNGNRPLLLVAQGKHGIANLGATEGQRLQLSGSLIHRDGLEMLEVLPDSIHAGPREPVNIPITDLGERTLRGEIVDSKCYLGVMNPGKGQVHRDCAANCIRGGVPPAFLSEGKVLLLEGLDVKKNLNRVGRTIELKGRLQQVGELLVLTVY
jgi:hypothetical protein